MKKISATLIVLLLLLITGKTVLAQVTTVEIKDSIAVDTRWTCNQQYLLKGYIYVTNNATLTIDPGVIIKGDKDTKGSLIIERGSKLIAAGTPTQPIVFTSNQPIGQRGYGDWGGVVLCGKAPINWNGGEAQVEGGLRSLYGGNNAHDNSGRLSYVRIEFPGIAFSPNNEINGLTLAGVGDSTQLDHIQVSYGGDDSYEWFGGTVNSKYLVSYRGWDDDFDVDNGYAGHNQFGVSLRDPFAADQSGSKFIEADSYQSGTATGLSGDTSKITKCVFANYTAVGPIENTSSSTFDPQYVAAVQTRRGSALSLLNSVLMGYPTGILIDESLSGTYGSTIANLVSGISQFKGVAIAGTPATAGKKDVFFVYNGARNLTPTTTYGDTSLYSFAPWSGPWGWFLSPDNYNTTFADATNDLRLNAPFNLSNPNFVPTATSPICHNSQYTFNPNNPVNTDTSNGHTNYNAPTLIPVNSNKLQHPLFENTNFIGAFSGTQTSADNWTAGWCNWNPVYTNYDVVCSANAIQEFAATHLYLKVKHNPVVNEALIGYQILQKTDVEISLFDIAGKQIQKVYSGMAEPGEFAYRLATSELKNGTYLLRVSTNYTQQTIKFIVAQ